MRRGGRAPDRQACAAGVTGPDQRRRRARGLGDPGWAVAARSMGLARSCSGRGSWRVDPDESGRMRPRVHPRAEALDDQEATAAAGAGRRRWLVVGWLWVGLIRGNWGEQDPDPGDVGGPGAAGEQAVVAGGGGGGRPGG